MPVPTYTPPPTAPTRGDPTTFSARFAAWLAWMATFVTQLIDGTLWMDETAEDVAADAAAAAADAAAAAASAEAALFATGYVRRSTANLAVGIGVKAVTGLNAPANAAFSNGDEVVLIAAGNAEIRQWGLASNVNAGAGTMDVTVAAGDFAGAGPIANWIVAHRAFESLLAASTSEVISGTSGVLGVTPKALRESWAPILQAYAATITPSRLLGKVRVITLAGNALFAIPTDIIDGDFLVYIIKQDATGNRLGTWAAGHTFDGGTQALSTAANAVDMAVLYVESAAGPTIRGVMHKAFSA